MTFRTQAPLLRLPVNPFRVVVNRGSPLARSLAFLFVPYRNIFVDIVRHDIATSSGTVTPIDTPFGKSFVMGTPTLSAVGGFKTAGADSYYNGISGNSLSIACGAFNQAVVTNPANRNVFTYWADNSTENNGIEVGLQINGGVMKPYCGATGNGTGNAVIDFPAPSPPLPPSGGMNLTVPLSTSTAASCDGNIILISASCQNTGPLTNASAPLPRTFLNLSQVFIGDQFAGAATGRALTWVAGWFRTLPAAELNAAVAGNGNLPPGLLLRRHQL